MELFKKKENKENNEDNKKVDLKNIKVSKAKYLEQKDMNFLERYETVVEGKQAKINPMYFIAPAAGVVGLIVAVVVLINVMTLFKTNSNKKINEFINDPANVASYNQAVELSKTIANINASKSAIEDVLTVMDNYPALDQKLVASIFGNATGGVAVEVINYDGTNGYLSITCSSTAVEAIPLYVKALDNTGEFSLVSYSGYTGGTSGYSFTVSCICNSK